MTPFFHVPPFTPQANPTPTSTFTSTTSNAATATVTVTLRPLPNSGTPQWVVFLFFSLDIIMISSCVALGVSVVVYRVKRWRTARRDRRNRNLAYGAEDDRANFHGTGSTRRHRNWISLGALAFSRAPATGHEGVGLDGRNVRGEVVSPSHIERAG